MILADSSISKYFIISSFLCHKELEHVMCLYATSMCKRRMKHPSQRSTHLPNEQTTQMHVNMWRSSWLSSQVPYRILRTCIRNIKILTPSAAQNGITFTTKAKQMIFVKMMKSVRADYHYQLYLRIHIRHFKTLTPSIHTTEQNGVCVTTEAKWWFLS
jgi:hypothetical protein